MSRSQAEYVIKNIIREIVHECGNKGHAVSETLVAFMVKAIVLDSSNKFNVDKTLTKEDIQKLIELCVARLIDTASPSLDTIKMQVYFDMNYTTRAEFLDEHHKVLESRMVPILREITDSRARSRDELDALYQKIVTAAVLQSGLGSATDISIVREATAALQSVFPQTELATFIALSKRDKERQLAELSMIVTGIRLFNKECGKGGEGIDDLPVILNEAIPTTSQTVDEELQHMMNATSKYITVVEALSTQPAQSAAAPSNPRPSVSHMIQSIINCRQYEAFLNVLLRDVVSCAQEVENLQSQLRSRMYQLQATVQSKSAVPTAQVYPQFMQVAELWASFQDEMVLLSVLNNIIKNLKPFTTGHLEKYPDEELLPHIGSAMVLTDTDRYNAGKAHAYQPKGETRSDMDWLYPGTTKNFDKIPLQYRGYCGWTIATKDRLLLHGIPDIGVLRYKDLCYSFASKAAAEEFSRDPDKFIAKVAEHAKKSPELIQLLELHTQFAAIAPYAQGKGDSRTEKPIIKCDSGTQTDTHFYESNIVQSYQWNEWELRRQAIKLTNLRTKVTHAVQTNLSNMRRDNTAQSYPPKELGTQTKKDHFTNVPKPQTYLGGLRGGGTTAPTVLTKVDLTLDVDQY